MQNLVKLFKILSDETRLRILNLLLLRDCCVCEVVQVLGISQASASRNLSQIYDCGILKRRIEGLWTIYSMAPDLSSDYRGAILNAIEVVLKQDQVSNGDRQQLTGTKRLFPFSKANCPQVEQTGMVS